MEVPGKEDEYKRELYQSLENEYETSTLAVPEMSKLYEKEHTGIISGTTEYIGIIDQRNVTPESLEQCIDGLMDVLSDRTSILEALGNEPHPIIIGVTDEITDAVREFIYNTASKHDRTYPYDVFVVDVKAGVVIGTEEKYSIDYGRTLKNNHLNNLLT